MYKPTPPEVKNSLLKTNLNPSILILLSLFGFKLVSLKAIIVEVQGKCISSSFNFPYRQTTNYKKRYADVRIRSLVLN